MSIINFLLVILSLLHSCQSIPNTLQRIAPASSIFSRNFAANNNNKDGGNRNSKSDSNPNCSGIRCENPANIACDIVSRADQSIPRPSGPKADCCPLWRCWERNGDFYTVHGILSSSKFNIPSGKEIVRYSSSKRGHIVSSVGTGFHGATANAGATNTKDIDKALKELDKVLDDAF